LNLLSLIADISFLTEPFLILIVTVLTSLFSGWAIASQLNIEPFERPAVSIAIGFSLMYLCEFGTYLLAFPSWLPFALILFISLATLCLLSRINFEQSKLKSVPWAETVTWLVLSLWGVAIQFKVVVYGAQWGWAGDWIEHYERSIFFLEQLPPDTKFLHEIYTLPSRGPLFNSSAGLLMTGLGKGFWNYQIIATALNAFPVLALAVLLQSISGLRRYPALIWSGVLFSLAPFAMQQVIYPWTKMFTTGFILLGIHFYIKGAKREDIVCMAWAFFPFTLGFLAHYMTALTAIFFLIHFVYKIVKMKFKVQPLIVPVISCIVFVATWFIFLIINFGVMGAFVDNTLGGKYVEEYHQRSNITLKPWEIFLSNTLSTLVPFSVRTDWYSLSRSPDILKQGWRFQPQLFSVEEIERNKQVIWKLHLINNQSTLPGNVGWAGFSASLMASILFFSRRLKPRNKTSPPASAKNFSPGSYFWVSYFFGGIFINLLSVKVYSPQGLSYVCFLPILFMFVVFLFLHLRDASPQVNIGLATLFLVESGFKSYIWVQMHARPVLLENVPEAEVVIRGPGLNSQYVRNYFAKIYDETFYLFDQFGDLSNLFSLICVGLIVTILLSCAWVRTRSLASRR
jgi:hypothetical protein